VAVVCTAAFSTVNTAFWAKCMKHIRITSQIRLGHSFEVQQQYNESLWGI